MDEVPDDRRDRCIPSHPVARPGAVVEHDLQRHRRDPPARAVRVECRPPSVGTNPDAGISTMTSLIAAGGSGRCPNVMPDTPACCVTTIAFIGIVSLAVVPQW